jgi:outer membrane protein assembly factor BamB
MNLPLRDAALENRLHCFDLKTGKLKWDLGRGVEHGGEWSSSCFLGPPLPLDDKLYVLNQKDVPRLGELRLACLNPAGGQNGKGSAEWIATLATMPEPLLLTPLRRTQALHIAYADGLLLCPTNAGRLIAVDRRTHKVRWTYTYSQAKKPGSGWVGTTPIIHDGKVVFTAPDGDAVYCVDLQTGKERWKAARDGDLYLGAVSSGTVLLVGPKRCRALRLADGRARWNVETGAPSGRGSLSAGRYYLPLQRGTKSGKAEICVLDLNKGRVLHSLRLPGGAVPGNLVFAEGILLSQSATELIGFVQVKKK